MEEILFNRDRDEQQRVNIKRHREQRKKEEQEESKREGKESAKFLE